MRRTRCRGWSAPRATRVTVAASLSSSAQQTNAERILSGRDTPSHEYDLIHQRIEVRNFDWDATAFDGKVTTTVVSLRPGLDSIVMDMGRRLAVRSVKRTQGSPSDSAGRETASS